MPRRKKVDSTESSASAVLPKTTKKKTTTKNGKQKEHVARTRKYGGELAFNGFDRKLYCWIRMKRYQCAIHKALYYEYSVQMIEDKQYDFLEEILISVEERHKKVATAVASEGYLSPNDYVGALSNLFLSETAKRTYDTWVVNGSKKLEIPLITEAFTKEKLYEYALGQINSYPI